MKCGSDQPTWSWWWCSNKTIPIHNRLLDCWPLLTEYYLVLQYSGKLRKDHEETGMREAQQKTGCAGPQVLSEAMQPKFISIIVYNIVAMSLPVPIFLSCCFVCHKALDESSGTWQKIPNNLSTKVLLYSRSAPEQTWNDSCWEKTAHDGQT